MPDLTLPPPTSLKILGAFLFRHSRFCVHYNGATDGPEGRFRRIDRLPGCVELVYRCRCCGRELRLPLAGVVRLDGGDEPKEVGLTFWDEGLRIVVGDESDDAGLEWFVVYLG